MKKTIIALMCATLSLAATAQPKNDNQTAAPCPNKEQPAAPCCNNQPAPQPMPCQDFKPQRHGMRGPQMRNSVINMHVVNSLGLDTTKVNAIRDLERKTANEMRDIETAMRPAPAAPGHAPMDKDLKADKKDKKDKDKKANKGDKKDKKSDKKDKKDKDKKGAPCCKAGGDKPESPTAEQREEMRKQFEAKREESRQKMQASRDNCRKELRQIMGDEKYIEYLEKLTQQPQQQQFRQQPQRRHHHGEKK